MANATIEQYKPFEDILPLSFSNGTNIIGAEIIDAIKSSKGSIRPSIASRQKAISKQQSFLPQYHVSTCEDSSEGNYKKVNTKKYFNVQNSYECWIDEIDQNTVYARGRDVNLLGPEITFEFDIKDVEENDRELVKESAVFWLKVGQLTTESGQQVNKMLIKFRRFESTSKQQIEKINQREMFLAKALGIDE